MAAKHCGAKTRAGGTCKAPAMANGRCRVHGGKSTGPKPENARGNKNAVKPGSLYSAHLTSAEQAVWDKIELGRIDDELRLARVRLARALAMETDKPELDEVTKRTGGDGTAPNEARYKRRDYPEIINRLLGRIASLEAQRLQLQLMQKQIDEANAGDGDAEVAGFEVVPYDD